MSESIAPIFTELTREISDPSSDDWTISEPPKFAVELATNALSGRHRSDEELTELDEDSAAAKVSSLRR